MANRQLHAQLTLPVSSPAEYVDIAYAWLDEGSQAIAPGMRAVLGSGGARSANGPALDAAPVSGEPFAAAHLSPRGGGDTRSIVIGQDSWQFLKGHLADASNVMLEITTVGFDGRRSEDQFWLTIDQDPFDGEPASVLAGMSFDETEALAADDIFRRRLVFLRNFAGRYATAFGHVSFSRQQGQTDLEIGLNLWPGMTIPRLGFEARGYSWITILDERLVGRLGGVSRFDAGDTFSEIEVLPSGATWLKATKSWSAYCNDPSRIEKVFRALAPILPGGVPTQLESVDPADPSLLLVMKDATKAL
jgi:hypothetical protein